MHFKYRLAACLAVFAALAGTVTGALAQGPDARRIENPNITISAAARGAAAIKALGVNLPSIAARYGKSAAELKKTLAQDRDLAVDKRTRLLYLCDGMKANSPAQTHPAQINGMQFLGDNTFKLHSRPGCTKVIYLDFLGFTTSGTAWNSAFTGGADIVSAPFDMDGDPTTFNATECAVIENAWQRVSEDYSPFDVDVTTEDPGIEGLRKTSSTDTAYGVRVVISPTCAWYPNAGGVAYVGSFNWSSDTPCFVFSSNLGPNNERYIAEAAAHEVGHTLGLSHDGVIGGSAYYAGQGNWAPIMGVGYYKDITQFSKGEYANANNTEDDIAVMAGYGATARPDDCGDTFATATPLSGTTPQISGVISTRTDIDMFSFYTGAGTITINLSPASLGANLDIRMDLYDSGGNLLTTVDPTGLPASLTISLPAGGYYVRVDGVGAGDPAVDGYSDYASLGQYALSASLIGTSDQMPVAVASGTLTSGTAPLVVAFQGSSSYDPDGTIASYSWNFGDGSTSTSSNPSHTYTTAGSFTATLTVTDNLGGTGNATVAISVSAPPLTSVHISAIAMSPVTSGRTKAAKVVATVVDSNGNVVPGAMVTGQFTGVVTGTASGSTDTTGKASMQSKSAKKSGLATYTMTGITGTGLTYDPTKNTVSSASIQL